MTHHYQPKYTCSRPTECSGRTREASWLQQQLTFPLWCGSFPPPCWHRYARGSCTRSVAPRLRPLYEHTHTHTPTHTLQCIIQKACVVKSLSSFRNGDRWYAWHPTPVKMLIPALIWQGFLWVTTDLRGRAVAAPLWMVLYSTSCSECCSPRPFWITSKVLVQKKLNERQLGCKRQTLVLDIKPQFLWRVSVVCVCGVCSK